MPLFIPHSKSYALESDGPNRLVISWNGGFYNIKGPIHLQLDRQRIDTILSRTEAEKGRSLLLPNGNELGIRLQNNRFEIHFNDQDISLLRHPKRDLKTTFTSNLAFAGILIINSVILLLIDPIKNNNPLTYAYLTVGIVFVFVSLWVRSNLFLSAMALITALLITSIIGIVNNGSMSRFLVFFLCIYLLVVTVINHRKKKSGAVPHENNYTFLPPSPVSSAAPSATPSAAPSSSSPWPKSAPASAPPGSLATRSLTTASPASPTTPR